MPFSADTRQIRQLKEANAAADARMGALQASLDAFKRDVKQYDSVIGPQGSLQALAKGLSLTHRRPPR